MKEEIYDASENYIASDPSSCLMSRQLLFNLKLTLPFLLHPRGVPPLEMYPTRLQKLSQNTPNSFLVLASLNLFDCFAPCPPLQTDNQDILVLSCLLLKASCKMNLRQHCEKCFSPSSNQVHLKQTLNFKFCHAEWTLGLFPATVLYRKNIKSTNALE